MPIPGFSPTSRAGDLDAEDGLGSGSSQTRLWWFGGVHFHGLKQKKDRETCRNEKSIGDDGTKGVHLQ